MRQMTQPGLYLLGFLVLIFNFQAFAQSPNIVSTTPSQNELNVSVSSNITATFDIDLDGSSIDSNTFIVSSSYKGFLSGVISYDNPSRTVSFNPTDEFVGGVVLSVTVFS